MTVLTLVFWKGPRPMFTDMDLFLHFGACFALVLAGNYGAWARGHGDAGWTIFASVMMLAVGLEIGQFFVHADFEAGDLVVDALGAFGGWAAWRLVLPPLRWSRR